MRAEIDTMTKQNIQTIVYIYHTQCKTICNCSKGLTTVVKFGKLEKSNRVATRQKEFSMSNFWSSIMVSAEVEPVVEQKSGFWESLGISSKVVEPVKAKAVQAVQSTTKKSRAVAKAEQVYETVDNLIVPTEDCVHHWMIPSENTRWAIGTCKVCKGEKWFSNRFIEEDVSFNDSVVPPKVDQNIANNILVSDVQDATANYNAEQNSAEEGE